MGDFVIISDLGNTRLHLNKDFILNVYKVGAELRGEIKELDIIVYEDNILSLLVTIKSYIVDLYEELSEVEDSELGGKLQTIKELLLTSISQTN